MRLVSIYLTLLNFDTCGVPVVHTLLLVLLLKPRTPTVREKKN